MNTFIIIPIGFIIVSVIWFGWCMASAGRGIAARIIFGIIGGGLFILIQGIIPMIFRNQVRQLCMEFPDPYVIVGIFIIVTIIIFFLGLILRSIMMKEKEK
ncbi:MAG: hypothetical protein JXI43_11750 [Tissierellales bacterium]|nr:hypothetical protein [Tissierellales bacterium]